MATVEQALELMRELERELRTRRDDIQYLTEYYNGEHRLRFASVEYREWFGEQYKGFSDNWTKPVADATTERLEVTGIRPFGEDKASEDLWQAWEESDAPAESSMAFSRAAVARRAFALVWGEEGEVTFEDPAQAIVGYEPGSRKNRVAALKLWRADEHLEFATLYTPDEVWKFQRSSFEHARTALVLPENVQGFGGWEPRKVTAEPWPLANPMGEVPMVELQHRPRLNGYPISEIEGVIPMQDAINALWSYLFTAADFAALPQRVILGAQLPKIPVLNDQGQVVGHKPVDLPEANVRRILNFEGPDAKIGQWDAAKLDTFTDVIEKCANHIGNQTRTPLYYFASSIENVGGDAMKMLETGLVSKIGEIKKFETRPIRETFRLMALARGDEALAEAVRGGTVLWSDHESRSDAQLADSLTKLAQIGFPFEWLAGKYVRGDVDELARIMEMREAEAELLPLNMMMKREQQNGEGESEQAGSGGNA